jgi:ribosomal protein S18 acetylase RimI-like enzyme
MRGPGADDTPALYHVSLKTGDVDGGDASSLYDDPELLGHLWLGAYLAFEPELARVVEDESGHPAGFVVAALDTVRFEQRCRADWWPPLRERYRNPPTSAQPWSLDEQAMAAIHRPERTEVLLAHEYPSHLHIALLPELQGHGRGRMLIEWVCGELRRRGSPGVHLGVDDENRRAVGFYRHLGFNEVHGYEGGIVFGRRF